jgi:transposase InsO family protein
MKPVRKRAMVDEVRRVWQVSIRRACLALPVDRSTYHYRSKRTGQAVLMKRIKEIAETRVRYGYRRMHVLLRQEGWLVNAKRVYRLYREMACNCATNRPSAGSGAAAQGPFGADRSQSGVGDGLCPRPALCSRKVVALRKILLQNHS